MSDKRRRRVCMLILNEVVGDSRVLRAAKAISQEYDLLVIGLDKCRLNLDKEAARRRLGLNIQWARLGLTGRLPRNAAGYGARYVEALARMVAMGIGYAPGAIHAHEDTALVMAMLIRTVTGARIIYDAHELYRDTAGDGQKAFGFWKSLSSRIETKLMQSCAGIIACNRQRAQIMQREYGAPFLPTVVRNMPPYRQRRPSAVLREYVATRNPKITHICLLPGLICPDRGTDVAVRALEFLPDNIGLVLMSSGMGGGGGQHVENVRELARQLNVAERVFVHPGVGYYEYLKLLSSADVGLIILRSTSRNNYYCAPNKLYEYAAAGLPTVGSGQPPIREMLEQYGTGLVFDTEDAQSLAEAVGKIVHDRQLYDRFSRNGLNAAKSLCWENESKVLLDLYRQLLDKS